MYAPSARSTLDALRAELASVWSAPAFDALAYAQCVRALKAELVRLGLTSALSEHERYVRAGKLAHQTRLAHGTANRGGWKVRKEHAHGAG